MDWTVDSFTEQDFEEYEELRCSGKVNMYGARPYLGWERDQFSAFLSLYSEVRARFPEAAARAKAAGERR